MNYISFLKERSFIITTIYSVVFNVLLDISTLCIVIIVNLISKTLIFSKGICLGSIYECIDMLYIIIDMAKAFIIVATASTAVFKLFTAI